MKLNLKSKKILIIEDHATMRKAINEMLFSLAAESTVEAANGEAAIAAMEKEKFDIVLCDYNLGAGKNGQQVLEEAKYRKLLPLNAIFIMVTAEQTSSMVLGAMESKPDEYLTKPFNAQQLAMRLERNAARKEYLGDIEQAMTAGRLSQAIQRCDAKLQQNDRKMHFQLLRLRAELAINAGDIDTAHAIYREALQHREPYWAQQGLGVIAYLQNDLDSAGAIFQKLIEEQPMQLEAYDWLAKCYESLGDFEAEQTTLNRATELSPQAILRQKKLAAVADKNGRFDVAEKAYKAAVNLGQYSIHKSSGDFSGLARIYAKTNAHQAALKTLKDMRERFNNDAESELRAATLETELYRTIGDAARSRQAYETAKALCQKLDDHIPTDLRLDFARTCYLNGDPEIANHQIEYALKNNIDDERFIDEVRDMLNSTGYAEQSDVLIQPIKQAMVEINNKGVELYKQGRLAEAEQVFQEAANAMPENRTIILNMVKILLYDLRQSGFDRLKFARAQAFLNKGAALGVKPDKIGYLKMQLEQLSPSTIAESA